MSRIHEPWHILGGFGKIIVKTCTYPQCDYRCNTPCSSGELPEPTVTEDGRAMLEDIRSDLEAAYRHGDAGWIVELEAERHRLLFGET